MRTSRRFLERLAPLGRQLRRAAAGALALAGALAAGQACAADVLSAEQAGVRAVAVAPDHAAPLEAPAATRKVVIGGSDVAEVGGGSHDGLYVIGRRAGATNLLVYGADGELLETVDVQVRPDAAALRRDLAVLLEDDRLTVVGLSSGVLLQGEVASPAQAAAVLSLAERVAPGGVISELQVRSSLVRLDVHVVEASERRLRGVGVDLRARSPAGGVEIIGGPLVAGPPQGSLRASGRAGSYDLDLVLRGLESRGAARILAQPSLVALSGEAAQFHAGGEFPYPKPLGDGRVGLAFRPYGASIRFLPTVQSNGLIRMEMEAELSGIDDRGPLAAGDQGLPALAIRRAATTTEMRQGEALFLGGLYSERQEALARSSPALARLPLVGPALRTRHRGRDRLELAFIVTPTIVSVDVDRTAAAASEPQVQVVDAPAPSASAAGLLTRATRKARVALGFCQDRLRSGAAWIATLPTRRA